MTLDITFTGGSARRHMAVLLIGSPGSGKTKTPSSFPSPLYAAAEANLMSIEDKPIPVQRITTSEKLKELKAFLDQTPDVRQNLLGFPVETLVVDTVDEVQRILKAERERARRKWERDDWGWLAEELRALVRGLRLLTGNGMNVVCTVHIGEDKDEAKGTIYKKPALQGQMAGEIAQYFDVVGLLRMEMVTQVVNGQAITTPRRWMQTYPDEQWECLKDGSGKLPFDFPIDFETDYDRMYQAIYGSAPPPIQQASIVVNTEAALASNDGSPDPDGPVAGPDPTDPAGTAPAASAPAPAPEPEPEVQQPEPAADPEPEPEPQPEAEPEATPAPEADPEPEAPKPARASRSTTKKAAAPKAAAAKAPEPEPDPEPTPEPAATNGNGVANGTTEPEAAAPEAPEAEFGLCEVCQQVLSEDERDMANYKLDRDLCVTHYKEARAAAGAR